MKTAEEWQDQLESLLDKIDSLYLQDVKMIPMATIERISRESIISFAREVAQASLNKAAENVKLERVDYFEASQEQHSNGVPYYYGEGDVPCELICVVKSSITDKSNIVL